MTSQDAARGETRRTASETVASLKVVPQKKYGLWIGTALVLVLMYFIIWAFAVNPAFGWDIAGGYMFHPRSCGGWAIRFC